jgi:D-cysteine desulfhydrase
MRSADRLVNRLSSLPRVPLLPGPTPLVPAPQLSDELSVEVWFKRDDLTGQGLGGNKVRGLEYLLGDAIARRCDTFITGAGPQSNWAMLAALTARRCGLSPYLVFYGEPVTATGNLLLTELTGADIRYTGELDRASVDSAIDKLGADLTAAGHRPYVVPRGGATALGSAGYVHASLELADQLRSVGLTPSRVWLATGSCGTQAGLVAGSRWLHTSYDVVGVSVSRPVAECVQRINALAHGVADLLGLPPGDRVTVLDGYMGPGYGLPSPAGDAATKLVARTEGVFLDPVFGAKAMAALVDAARSGRVEGPVVFLVSGGAPTLFAGAKGSL